MGNMHDCREEYIEMTQFKFDTIGQIDEMRKKGSEIKYEFPTCYGNAGDIAGSRKESNIPIGTSMQRTIVDNKEEYKKDTKGKLDLSLAPPLVEEMFAKAATLGNDKYGRNNWLLAEPKDIPKAIASMKRHLNKFRKGIYLDEESGESHMCHAQFWIVFIENIVQKHGFENCKQYLV